MLSCLARSSSWARLPLRAARISSLAIQANNEWKSPTDLLKAVGRSSETKLEVENWKQLQNMTGLDMKKAGVGVKDRRYILWALEKSRQGESPSEFAHEPKPKKKVRGWGPRVQNGKVIKSRRRRMQRR